MIAHNLKYLQKWIVIKGSKKLGDACPTNLFRSKQQHINCDKIVTAAAGWHTRNGSTNKALPNTKFQRNLLF